MNYIPEVLFSSIVYLVQIVSLVGIALGLSRIFSLIVKTKHSKARFVIIASIIFVMIAATTANPPAFARTSTKNPLRKRKGRWQKILRVDYIPPGFLCSRCGLRLRISNMMDQE